MNDWGWKIMKKSELKSIINEVLIEEKRLPLSNQLNYAHELHYEIDGQKIDKPTVQTLLKFYSVLDKKQKTKFDSTDISKILKVFADYI